MLRTLLALSTILLMVACALAWALREPSVDPWSAPPSAETVESEAQPRLSATAVEAEESEPGRRPVPSATQELEPDPAATGQGWSLGPASVPVPSSQPFRLGQDPIDPEATVAVHVDVFTPDGSPQPDALVQVVRTPAGTSLDPSTPVVEFAHRMWRNNDAVPFAAAEARTGSDGRVTLSVPRTLEGGSWLRVVHRRWLPFQQRLGGAPVDGERFRVGLRAGATLRGLVHGELPTARDFGAGLEVTRISVLAFPMDGERRLAGKWADLELDESSPRAWSLAGLAPGAYEIEVMAFVKSASSSKWKTVHALQDRVWLPGAGAVRDVPIVLPAIGRAFRCAMR